MLFTEPLFLFYFLPFALVIHSFAARFSSVVYRARARWTIFGLTLLFYGLGQPWWLIPFFISITFDFIWASWMTGESRPRVRKLLCGLSLVQNLSLLGFFKYRDFIIANLSYIFPSLLGKTFSITINGEPLSMPPGISFYTFESLSFVIDVYRREIAPPKKAHEFFAFIGMFPRFVAGPIVRYREMIPQFQNYRGPCVAVGLFLFSVGLFFKSCIADSFAVFVKYAFDLPLPPQFFSAWVGVLSYAFQIYFDFAGYSLMAIGLGRALGFQFPGNFRSPYHAQSFQDFWRRWHITLSRWLRDYLYISLGGSQKGTFRTCLNLFLTMLLGGIWHGAGWGFVVWGLWHGLLLCVERAFSFRTKLSPFTNKAITFWGVLVGWVFFRASFLHAKEILCSLFLPRSLSFDLNLEGITSHLPQVAMCTVGLVVWIVVEPRVNLDRLETMELLNGKQVILGIFFLTLSLLTLFSGRVIPFLYFQF